MYTPRWWGASTHRYAGSGWSGCHFGLDLLFWAVKCLYLCIITSFVCVPGDSGTTTHQGMAAALSLVGLQVQYVGVPFEANPVDTPGVCLRIEHLAETGAPML